MTHSELVGHLERAEESVRKARQSWDATDLSRCAECLEQLRRAAAEMQAVQGAAGDSTLDNSGPSAKAKERLLRLLTAVDRLGRLVDSAIAFHRGLALHSGMAEAVPVEGNG